jgi:metallopeptidase MepB
MDKPQPPIDFPTQPADTIQRARAAIARTKEAEDRVVRSTAIDDASFDNVLLPLILDENTRRCEERVLGLFASVHPSKDMRDASSEASRLFDDATVESFQREDISRLVDAVVQQNDPLDDESRHYLKKRNRKYLDYGLKMPAPARDRFAAVRKRISDLTRECQKNYNMDNSGLWIDPQELAGVPDNVVGRFKRQGRQVWHPLKRADVTTTLQHAQNAESRKAILAATEKKCPDNLALMKELFVLRHDMATSLGYRSYAAWQLEGSVAGSPENVSQFLNDLRDKLTPIAKADLSRLAGLKSQHPGQLHYWDFPYYRARLLKEDYDVDQDLVAEYFPFEVVLAGLLEMFRALYGIKMCPPSQPILTWHVDVTALEAWDEDGQFCGHLYLDLHPREFKRSASGHWRLNQVGIGL